jgi:hypothetical protein
MNDDYLELALNDFDEGNIEEMLENDEITAEEAGFLLGYIEDEKPQTI